MDPKILKSLRCEYYNTTLLEKIKYAYVLLKEKLVGVDCLIFDKAIMYYKEVKGRNITRKEALSRALDKKGYREAWFNKDRKTIKDMMSFYSEFDFYIFRNSYTKRMGGFSWYMRLMKYKKYPAILEYGCGTAELTEKLIEKFPNCDYTVADIKSATLDFVKWKKRTFKFNYNILTIGEGKEGIPLTRNYDLIICQQVLEHTPNPLDIVLSFIEHLYAGGILIIDFINAPGAENLEISVSQRDAVKLSLKNNLIALKAIDEPDGSNGIYVKDIEKL